MLLMSIVQHDISCLLGAAFYEDSPQQVEFQRRNTVYTFFINERPLLLPVTLEKKDRNAL